MGVLNAEGVVRGVAARYESSPPCSEWMVMLDSLNAPSTAIPDNIRQAQRPGKVFAVNGIGEDCSEIVAVYIGHANGEAVDYLLTNLDQNAVWNLSEWIRPSRKGITSAQSWLGQGYSPFL